MGENIEIISKKVKTLEKANRFARYMNSKVYSKSGEYIGKVYDVVFDKVRILGVLVSGKKRIFIDKQFIGKISEDAIVLNIEPVTSMIGKQVYDAEGKKIGTVSGLQRKSNANTFSDILVKRAIYRRAFSIDKKEIGVAKKNIILKRAYGEDK